MYTKVVNPETAKDRYHQDEEGEEEEASSPVSTVGTYVAVVRVVGVAWVEFLCSVGSNRVSQCIHLEYDGTVRTNGTMRLSVMILKFAAIEQSTSRIPRAGS